MAGQTAASRAKFDNKKQKLTLISKPASKNWTESFAIFMLYFNLAIF
jgi:hypothetical protein